MLLSSFTQGKNNNFNLIRFIAASAVLFGHSFALLKQPEPLGESLGMTIGSISVDLFFITSGFLVTGSLLTRKSASEYIWARILRIYPALIAVTVLTVFGLGAYFTSLPLSDYLSHSDTYAFLIKCSTIIGGVSFYLPSVFNDNPYKGAVNGSLWTMVYEIKMYILLLIFWFLCGIRKGNKTRRIGYVIVANALLSCAMVLARRFYDLEESHFLRFDFMFFAGAASWVLKDRISLTFRLFAAFCAGLILAAFISKLAFFVVYQLTIVYILLYLAFIPDGFVRKFNAFGDSSYGIYIYAFPIQQSIIAVIPGISVLSLAATSLSATLCFAFASWHFLEQRALNLKKIWLRGSNELIPKVRISEVSQ